MRKPITEAVTKFDQEVELEMMVQMTARVMQTLDWDHARNLCDTLDLIFSGYLLSKKEGDITTEEIDSDLFTLNLFKGLLKDLEEIRNEAKLADAEKKLERVKRAA